MPRRNNRGRIGRIRTHAQKHDVDRRWDIAEIRTNAVHALKFTVGQHDQPALVRVRPRQILICGRDAGKRRIAGLRDRVVDLGDVCLRTVFARHPDRRPPGAVALERTHVVDIHRVVLAQHRREHFHCVLRLTPPVDLFAVCTDHAAGIVVDQMDHTLRGMAAVGKHGRQQLQRQDEHQQQGETPLFSAHLLSSSFYLWIDQNR